MNHQAAYKDFTARFKPLIGKNPHLITTTLSNIFTMRLIGNKTHGDLAEIAIAEFINRFMYDFRAERIDEGLIIINEITGEIFLVKSRPRRKFTALIDENNSSQIHRSLVRATLTASTGFSSFNA
jgi:hypothetical protein